MYVSSISKVRKFMQLYAILCIIKADYILLSTHIVYIIAETEPMSLPCANVLNV